MIIYSLAAGGKVSIAALILAGLVPAVILTVSNLTAAYLVAIKRGYPAGTFPGWDAVWRSLAAALPGWRWWRSSSSAFSRACSPRPSRRQSR